MATIRFFVNGQKRELTHIYIRLTNARGQRHICKTGLLVEPQRWSNDTQTIKQRIHSTNDETLLKTLASLKEYITTQNRFQTGVKSDEWLQTEVNKFYGLSSGTNSLNTFFTEFITRMDKGELKNKSAINYVKGTVRKFKGTQGVFNRFQGIYSDKDIEAYRKEGKVLRELKIIDFNDINKEFYREFVNYMSDEGYKTNTIGRVIKDIKHIMSQALTEKKHGNREFERFNVMTEDSHATYLTPDEIDKLWKHNCKDKRTEIARDCFIVLCETALRISDYRKINIGIRGRFIDIYQTKTSDRVIIPLTARMEQILDKYAGKLPYIHENYVNEFIKNVAFECKLTDKVTWVTQVKGFRIEKSEPKWKLITCHTGRRSAATNMYLAGISPIDIMKITGHRTEKSFMRYIRVTQEEVAQKLALHPYFSNMKVV